jgi:hypothetical protein
MQKQPSTGLALKVAGIALIALGALLYGVLGGPDDNRMAFPGGPLWNIHLTPSTN